MKKVFLLMLCVLLLLPSACTPNDANMSDYSSETAEGSGVEESGFSDIQSSEAVLEESTDTSAPEDSLIGTTITITDHSKIIGDYEITEITRYSNGIKTETIHRYFDETLEQISSIFVNVTRGGKYVYKSYENYNESGELESKNYYSCDNEGNHLEVIVRDYSNHHQTVVYSSGGTEQQHFYAKDIDSFKIELHDENGYHRKTYIDGEMVGYEKMYYEGDARCYDEYGKDMKLLKRQHYGTDGDDWTDCYLDDGRILRVTTESDGGTFCDVLWVYTDDPSEMERITDFNMENHAYAIYYMKPADGITESEAEAYLNEYMELLKKVKEIEKLWYTEYFGEESE